MKKKVAKLVLWSPISRVVVDEDASYEDIVEAAREKFAQKVKYEYLENVEDVIDDEECPYDLEEDEGEEKVFVKVHVPTKYQYSSVSSFGIPVKSNLDGSVSAEQEFPSIEAAEDFLLQRAGLYAQTEEELLDLTDEVLKHNTLTLDAATAYIETVINTTE